MAFDLESAKPIEQQSSGFDLSSAKPVGEKSWGDVAQQSVSNILPSVGNLIGGVAHAVAHPIDTASSLGGAIVGAGESITGKIASMVAPELVANTPISEREKLANQLGDFYKQRYGSMEGFKQALSTDPAGILADASTLLTGGGSALSKIGALSKSSNLARAGELVSTAGSAVDPLANTVRAGGAVAKVVSKALPEVIGIQTGAGADAIKEAYNAGKEGGKRAESFQSNLRGEVPMQDVLDTAKQNLSQMNAKKSAEYRSGLYDISQDKTILDFTDIDKSIANAQKRTHFGSKVTDQTAAEAVDAVRNIIDDWKNDNPAKYHTPEGLDALKRKINDEVLSKLDIMKEKNARGAVGDIYNSVKSAIVSQAPKYAEVMREYHNASDQIDEITKTLSLGEKSQVDTAMRKLQSLMRNNANTNYGNRLNLARELEQGGGQAIMPQLAGQALNNLTPRGLQRAALAPTSLLGYSVGGAPLAIGGVLTSSPRLMGESAYYAGKVAGVPSKISDKVAEVTAKFDAKHPFLRQQLQAELGINALVPYAKQIKNNPRVVANALYQSSTTDK